MSGELEHNRQAVDEVSEEQEPWVDPLDEWPPRMRDYAKAVRATALLYVVLRNADRVDELLREYARRVDELVAMTRGEG